MASGNDGVHILTLDKVEIDERLIQGAKFLKWTDHDTNMALSVTLQIDSNGFFLYWRENNKEREVTYLDISQIRDIRTGVYARVPKDAKLRDNVSLGPGALEDKTVTVVHGHDFVNTSFINFCAKNKETAKTWHDELFKITSNVLAANISSLRSLKKIHTLMTLMTNIEGKISIKNILRLFAQNKEDRKTVERALEASDLPSKKDQEISPKDLDFTKFFSLYRHLVQRKEIESIFQKFTGGKGSKLMSTREFLKFVNGQRDPRLSEILFPYCTEAKARALITIHEQNKKNAENGNLSLEGFLRYLLSEDNQIVAPERLDLHQSMNEPLSHYFIQSSHNTYLTGHQWTGKSSVEMYRQVLLSGCRCIELDLWDGKTKDEEPIIVHGYTLVPEIVAKDVIMAIAECAFKTSDYPVILSFENHCRAKQQAKIAAYCREYFGDMLLSEPLESHKLERGVKLPSPNDLKRKIIIKNKKKHMREKPAAVTTATTSVIPTTAAAATTISSEMTLTPTSTTPGEEDPLAQEQPLSAAVEKPATATATTPPTETPPIGASGITETAASNEIAEDGSLHDDKAQDSADSESEDEDIEMPSVSTSLLEQHQRPQNAGKESRAAEEISVLVNYVQAVHFHGFEHAERRNRSYEMSSFEETSAVSALKETPIEFVNYNKRQLSRIFPRGTRADSSNFMPQVFWNAGCQLVALNYQTLDLGMQLNLGIFEYNKKCGYLQKPFFMCREDRTFDPFADTRVDGIVPATVSIQVLSGQFLTDRHVGTYVEVDMFGLPCDTVRRKFRTKVVPNNGICPIFNDEPFTFKQVVVPDLAVLRIAVYEESGRFIGHRVLPVAGLRPGYRHISLRSESGQFLTFPTLFCLVTVQDYVPDRLSDFAEALSNPIAYANYMDERAKALSILTDGKVDENGQEINSVTTTSGTNAAAAAAAAAGATAGGGTSASASDRESSLPTTTSGVIASSIFSAAAGAGAASASAVSTAAAVSTSPGSTRGKVEFDSNQESSEKNKLAARRTASCSNASTHSRASVKSNGSVSTSSIATTAAAVSNNRSGGNGNGSTPIVISASAAETVAEPVEVFLSHKSVTEKEVELQKRLNQLNKKYEKELEKLQLGLKAKEDKLTKASQPKYATAKNKLVKILSEKTLEVSRNGSLNETEEQEKLAKIRRHYEEKIQSLTKEKEKAEAELKEKYFESIWSTAEKLMKASQTGQFKMLQTYQEKDKEEVMKKIELEAQQEIKELKDATKEDILRVKKERRSFIIKRNVEERKLLQETYTKLKKKLEDDHEDVRTKFFKEKELYRTKVEEMMGDSMPKKSRSKSSSRKNK